MKTFGNIIKNKREELGYSENYVGEILNINPTSIVSYENDIYTPSLFTFKKICDLYCLDFKNSFKLLYNKDFNFTYANILKYRRRELNLSLEEVCKILGIKYNILVEYESGNNDPRKHITELCNLYKLDEDKLIILVHNLDINNNFGDRLKFERLKNHLSIYKLYEKINIDCNSLTNYELGNSIPDKYNLNKISNYFNISFEELSNMIYPLKDKTFGDLIKSIRYRKFLSLDEASDKIGITKFTLQRAENNTSSPMYTTLRKICDFYELDLLETHNRYFKSDYDKKNISSLGCRLKKLRIKSKFTREEVCDILNISQIMLYRYETNKSIPDTNMIIKMCKLYGVEG